VKKLGGGKDWQRGKLEARRKMACRHAFTLIKGWNIYWKEEGGVQKKKSE